MEVRRTLLLGAALSLVPTLAMAQDTGRRVSLGVDAALIKFNKQDIRLTGRVEGLPNNRNVRVTLRSATTPFTRFTNRATTRTAADGTFSFTQRPGQNVAYDVLASQRPTLRGPTVRVLVFRQTTIKLSSGRPRIGRLLRVSGFVYPPDDGQSVELQYGDGSPEGWRTVDRSALYDVGATRSGYRFKVNTPRTRREVRVVVPDDGRWVTSPSNDRSVRPRR